MSECQFIDRENVPDPNYNTPVDYDGYVFYRHHDGFGSLQNVQFCKLVGRKRDVFECLNENEWKACPYYRSRADAPDSEE